MIYLFDDKRNRQNDFGWNQDRFFQFRDILQPIYNYTEIESEESRREIFSEGNTILFHESFFDNSLNPHDRTGLEIRNRLNESASNKNLKLIYFSGSKQFRSLNQNIGNVPVSVLYQNLEVFLNKIRQVDTDLRYLLFGKNKQIEKELLQDLDAAQNKLETTIDNPNPNSRNFIARTQIKSIDKIFKNATYETLFVDDTSDDNLSKLIYMWFFTEKYDNIFIPLCFGSTLSDFNGLRFAMHIRCSDSPNRVTNIFLYSFTYYDSLVNNEYFDILKTKNIFLIDYKKSAFVKAVETSYEALNFKELAKEMKRISLSPPKNYEDNHSISNEWAIYRWATAIDTKDKDIEHIINRVQNHLYFKFLCTIYPSSDVGQIPESKLKIGQFDEPRILYIDDDAEKGWFQIFCKILVDINNLDFDYLDEEFNSKTKEDIIKIAVDKIIEKEIDLVILDFRLHPDDFISSDIYDVTGLKLLIAIKELNPGIQVIIFSATNKIWNFQALIDSGADGFIVKESPVNSVDNSFTPKAIQSFLSSIEIALERKFLKQVFIKCNLIENHLINTDYEDDSDYADFILDLRRHIKLVKVASNKINLKEPSTLDVVFLNCFSFLEKFKHEYVKIIQHQFVLGAEEVEMNRYSLTNSQGKFLRENSNDKPSWFQCMAGLFIDYFAIATTGDNHLLNLNKVKEVRNDYIHGRQLNINENELLLILEICVEITSNLRE